MWGLTKLYAALCLAVLLSQPAAADTKVAIGSSPSADYLPVWVAQEEGFFKNHGLDATVQTVVGSTILPGLQSGSLQIAGVPPTAALTANDGGFDLVAIAGASVSTKSGKNYGILVGPESGVKKGADLAGKKLAVAAISGFSYVMALEYIQESGLNANQVKFVEVPMPQVGDALKSKSIDASVALAPYLVRATESTNSQVLVYLDSLLPEGTQITPFTSTREWAESNPEAVAAFRASIAEAITFIKQNPEKSMRHLAKYTKLPPEVLSTIVLPAYKLEVTETEMRYWVDLARKHGLIRTDPTTSLVVP